MSQFLHVDCTFIGGGLDDGASPSRKAAQLSVGRCQSSEPLWLLLRLSSQRESNSSISAAHFLNCPNVFASTVRIPRSGLWLLKLNARKTKIMASGPITSWQIDGETVETVADFIFLGSKITADGDCSHEIKRHLLLGRKVMTNLDSILKSRGIPLPTKVCLVKAVVFPVVMYGCESWTMKKAECRELMLLKFGVGEDS